ncbi:MAG TPA: glycosyltransferase [Candidatus Saccharimonadales bacterium]|jgi:1,2-diacylglycerol-3-alpha-glucose alpha-1,2-galactosyltransferase|nr:glycosyltransferase [Candidatus Saccharimonadales bacterium]
MNKKISVNVVSESDISVQGHGVHTAYVEMISALKKYTDLNVIVGNINEYFDVDIIHFHTIGPRTWRKLLQKGPRKVMSAHIVPDSLVGSLILARYWKFLAVWYMRWFYNRADVLLAVSEEARRDLVQLGVTVPIEIFYNFIDKDEYKTARLPRNKIRAKLNIPDDAFVVIGAGQVQPRKRVDCFFDAAEKMPDVHFIWAGGMPFGRIAADSAHMKRMMESSPENVHFAGMIPLADMVSYYKAADLFWLPSEQETFGLVVVEAAAAGLPVMVRDIADYDDTFGNDAARCDDVTQLAMLEKFRDDAGYYDQQKQKAMLIAERFDSSQAAAKLVEIYRQLI